MAEEPAPEAQAPPALEGSEAMAGAEASTTEASEEEVELNIWWPKDTGPFRRERPKPDARPQHRHPRKERPERKPQAGDGNTPPAKAQKSPSRPQRPRPEHRPEKPIDPDSPFAVLGALKAQLAKKT